MEDEALREEILRRLAEGNIVPAASRPEINQYIESTYGHRADAIMKAVTRHTQAAEVAARIDELKQMSLHTPIPPIHNNWYLVDWTYLKERLAELKATRPGSEGEG